MPDSLAATIDAAQPCRQESDVSLDVFATCPSSLTTPDDYLGRVRDVARWSEAAGCAGILVYTDNSLVDPWLVSQLVIQSTQALCPLVAIQPVYMHPYSVAKIVSTLALFYNRRVFLNMVAGGFKNDLAALNDRTPHDSRYARLIEYTQIVQRLLEGRAPLTFEGQFYRVENLTLQPRMKPELFPGVFMSGSSDAGLEAARTVGAVAVQYPPPPGSSPDDDQEGSPEHHGPSGIRIGIVTRPSEDEAWDIAISRFPEDRKGQLTRQLATKVSDSTWHQRLSEIGGAAPKTRKTYWLQPFENYQTNCPYLVGSYGDVAEQLGRYVQMGYRSFILDIPDSQEEYRHIGTVFQTVSRSASRRATAEKVGL